MTAYFFRLQTIVVGKRLFNIKLILQNKNSSEFYVIGISVDDN